MKQVLLLCCVLIGFATRPIYAQMATAQKMQWDLEKQFDVPVERDSVWSLLKDYRLVSQLSNGFVQSIVHKDDIMPILREATYKDGTKRENLLTQLEEQHRFLVFKIKESSLPEGVTHAETAIFLKEKGDNQCEVIWRGLVKGNKESKAKYLEFMKTEADQYETGLKGYLKGEQKAVQMMRMQ